MRFCTLSCHYNVVVDLVVVVDLDYNVVVVVVVVVVVECLILSPPLCHDDIVAVRCPVN